MVSAWLVLCVLACSEQSQSSKSGIVSGPMTEGLGVPHEMCSTTVNRHLLLEIGISPVTPLGIYAFQSVILAVNATNVRQPQLVPCTIIALQPVVGSWIAWRVMTRSSFRGTFPVAASVLMIAYRPFGWGFGNSAVGSMWDPLHLPCSSPSHHNHAGVVQTHSWIGFLTVVFR